MAGATDAVEHLKQPAPKEGEWWEVDLPNALAEQHASLVSTVDSATADQIVLDIHAQIENRSAQQTLRFTHTEGTWKLAKADVPL